MKRTHHSAVLRPFPVTQLAVETRRTRWRTAPLRQLFRDESKFLRENRPTFPVRSTL